MYVVTLTKNFLERAKHGTLPWEICKSRTLTHHAPSCSNRPYEYLKHISQFYFILIFFLGIHVVTLTKNFLESAALIISVLQTVVAYFC